MNYLSNSALNELFTTQNVLAVLACVAVLFVLFRPIDSVFHERDRERRAARCRG